MDSNKDANSFLPLTEATFFILMSLAPGPRHGYAILKAVHEMSHGRITFSTGTLYGALKRLLDLGWIAREGDDDAPVEDAGRARKEYALTSFGRSVLDVEVARMRDLVRLASSTQVEGA